VPILLAILAIIGGLGLVAIVAQIWELSIFVVNMLTGMGLALGIDYSLFVISRYREERTVGREEQAAIEASGATASRAVLFSGTAFVIAMLGMLIVPNTVMRSLAAGAILVGVTSLAAALTLLPAVLGLLGDRVNSLRIPLVGGGDRKPVLELDRAPSLASPGRQPDRRLLPLDRGRDPCLLAEDRDERDQHPSRPLRLQARLPPAPEGVSAGDRRSGADRRGRRASEPAVRAALRRLQSRLAASPEFGRGLIRYATDGNVAALDVPIHGDDASDQALSAVRNLRSTVIPDVFGATDARVLVGGRTAEQVDYADSVTNPTPYVFVFVLGFTLILLTLAFRSIVVAGTSILLNLLSVGAAYGLIVLVFEKGYGNGIFGFERADTIEAWVPLFLFSVLFGLSMDYQVFLLSRIKERYDETGDTTGAVTWASPRRRGSSRARR
jgi:RND superfamily putative drug exporter